MLPSCRPLGARVHLLRIPQRYSATVVSRLPKSRNIGTSSPSSVPASTSTPPPPSSKSTNSSMEPTMKLLDRFSRRPSRVPPSPSFMPQPFGGGYMAARNKVKSGPFTMYSGRTKPVIDGDIAGAFKSLNITLRNNAVAKEYRAQKFYEKPSDKRVRLNRVRHRKRFLSGVKRLVNLVKEQRKFT